MIKHTAIILAVGSILLFINACTSRQELYISGSGEGTVSIDVNLDDMVVKYSRDLLGGFSGGLGEDIRLFNTQRISHTISALPGVDLINISSESADILHMELAFRNPARIFKELEVQGVSPIISFSTLVTGGKETKRLELYLSKDNFNTASTLLGLDGSEVLDTFGPQENPYTDNEYLDLMDYLFEEYESAANIRSIVKSSVIIINLKIDGRIRSCSGCFLSKSSSTAEIKIPVLDIVTLEEPIKIVVEWE